LSYFAGMSGIRRSGRVDLLVPCLMVAGLAAALVAPVIFLIELFEWATRSEWPGLTVADGLSLLGIVRGDLETDSQRLDDLLMAAPLTVALFVTGVYLFLFGASLGRWERERQLYEEFRGKAVVERLTLWGDSGVGYPTAFRLLFLTVILHALTWLGLALVGAEVILHVLGAELRWLAISGLLVLAGVLTARGAVRRKLPSLED
jgi:hypothetical protein